MCDASSHRWPCPNALPYARATAVVMKLCAGASVMLGMLIIHRAPHHLLYSLPTSQWHDTCLESSLCSV